ncbi:YfiR family protein [Hydrogenophaga sp.]|uniref:YfiR family protein n=1 Tax=Hydrogenophaga sp. TaxID=1904254 RepID=UPI003D141AF1
MSVAELTIPQASRAPGRDVRRSLLITGLLLMAATIPPPVWSTAPLADEEAAAHVQRFVGYIEWPAHAFASPSSAIVVGVAGTDQTLTSLARAVVGQRVQGRPLDVRRLDKPSQLANVHLIYVGRDAWKDLKDWALASRQKGVVLATNAPDGIARGAVLGLVQSEQRTRFAASVPAATEVGVKLSARLLEVAESVVGGDK